MKRCDKTYKHLLNKIRPLFRNLNFSTLKYCCHNITWLLTYLVLNLNCQISVNSASKVLKLHTSISQMRFRASLNDQRQFEINQLPEILQKATRTKFVNFGSIVISFSPAQTSVASKELHKFTLV